MFQSAIGFLVLGLVAMFLGANNLAGISIEVGKLLLFVFATLSVISVLVGIATGRNPKSLN